MAACTFPAGVVFNIELKERYWYAAQECVDTAKIMASKARIAGSEDAGVGGKSINILS